MFQESLSWRSSYCHMLTSIISNLYWTQKDSLPLWANFWCCPDRQTHSLQWPLRWRLNQKELFQQKKKHSSQNRSKQSTYLMKDNICLENDNWKRSYTIRMHNGGSFEGVFVIDGAIIVWILRIFLF